MRTSCIHFLSLVAALGLSAHTTLFATALPITVANPGFESPVLTDGVSTSALSGWSEFGNVNLFAVWNPDAPFYASGAPEGQNIADIYLSGAFSGCSQVLEGAAGQFQAETTYELKVKVGSNLLDPFDGYIIQLVVDDIVIAQDDNSRVPAAGSFVLASVRYSYNASLHSGLVGYPIEIRLLTKGLAGGFGDVNFDDVQLTYESSNPVAIHGGPYRLSQGNTLSLNGSASLPSPGAAITTYEWDLDGDGDFDEAVTGATPAAIPYATLTTTYGMALGENTIHLRITDNAAKSTISSTTVTIYALYTYIGGNFNRASDDWNKAAKWSPASVPTGLVDVSIPASISPQAYNANTPLYTGNLYLGANSQLVIGWTTQILGSYNALGTPGSTTIHMAAGSMINTRMGGTPIIPAIQLNGNASISLGTSTQTGAQALFNYPISGTYRLQLLGNSQSNCVANLNAVNGFSELLASGSEAGLTIKANTPGSLGTGDVTIAQRTGSTANYAILEINATNSMADTATLSISGTGTTMLSMNANDTISRFILNGSQLPAGTYGSTSSAATFKYSWITGTGILTVTEAPGMYWDINGTTAGAGGVSPAGNWDATSYWSSSSGGATATSSWVAGKSAVFAAGSDATGPYTVTVGGPAAISVTNSTVPSVTGNSGTSSLSVTRSNWDINGGNAVVVLFSAKNVSSFSATYGGQAMTIVGVLDANKVYTGFAYIIDPVASTADVVLTAPYSFGNSNNVLRYAYSIVSLANVASAVTPATRTSAGTLTYTTSTNNAYVFGAASNNNWQQNPAYVTGNPNLVLYQGNPGYFNTVHAHGVVADAGAKTDTYGGTITGAATLAFNSKATSNPLLSGQKIGGLSFEEGSVSITGSILEMQTNSSFSALSGATGTVASQITGLSSAGLTKKGLGTVVLSNASNNYTGATMIQNGILRLGVSNALPSTAVTLAGDGPGTTATLDLNGFSNTVASLYFGGSSTTSGSAITTGLGTLTLNGDVAFSGDNAPLGGTISGNLSLGGAPRTFNIGDSSTAAEDLTISAAIGGTGGLAKIGFGTLLLSGNNTYTGMTTVGGGLLVLSGTDNSAATGGITVNINASIRFDAPGSINGTGENVTIQAGGLAYFGPSFGGANIPIALTNRIDPASEGVIAVDNFASIDFDFSASGLNVYLGALSDVTYTGTFSPNGGVYRIGGGSGTIILSGANALTGASGLLVGGNVIIANSNDLNGATTISSTGRLQIGAGGTAGSLSSSVITNNGTLLFYRSDVITQGTDFQSPISGTGVVEQSGAGVLVLNAENIYSGGTNLVAGTLRMGHAQAIGSGELTIYTGTLDAVGPGALTLTSNNAIALGGNFTFGGTADLNMGTGDIYNFGNQTITLNGTTSTLTLGGVMTNISGGDQTLTVNGPGNTLVLGGYEMSSDIFAANIALTIGGTGNVAVTGTVEDWSVDINDVRLGSLTKTGSGTLTLSGNNNYTGNTVVTGGVLHLASGSQNSPVFVNSGGTLAFTLNSTITSTKKLTLNAGHQIRIVGTPTLSSYTLITASSIAGGLPELEDPIFGYELVVDGNSLKLTSLGDTFPPELADMEEDAPRDPADLTYPYTVLPIPPNTLVTYTVSFSEDIDDTTVSAADFDNVGTSAVTIGTITETAPGVFTVPVTPTSVGTLQLRIPTNADIRDIANNLLDSDPALLDDTTIEVQAPYTIWSGGGSSFDNDANGDGIANGLAWLLGASDLNEDALQYLPVMEEDAGDIYLYFTTLTTAARGTASMKVQYSKDMGVADLWTTHEAEVPDVTSTVNGIEFVIQPFGDIYLYVEARIPASGALPGKKLFARVSATLP